MKLFSAAFAVSILMGVAVAHGQTPQNFTLEAVLDDSNASIDSKFELKNHKGKVVVLHFLLKTECPFCLRYTNQYALLSETVAARKRCTTSPRRAVEVRVQKYQVDCQN